MLLFDRIAEINFFLFFVLQSVSKVLMMYIFNKTGFISVIIVTKYKRNFGTEVVDSIDCNASEQ